VIPLIPGKDDSKGECERQMWRLTPVSAVDG
jgi:hypothetical protein